jgi:multidrug resistance efflux pump
MVSSGRVNSDLASIKSSLSNYDNLIGEMSGSWKGMSYDNLVSKANVFFNEFSSSISSQMNSFANACDLYERYQETKSSLSTARSNYNSAVQSNDKSAASSYSSKISSLESDLQSLKGQIENALAAVTGVKVEATPTTTTPTRSSLPCTSGIPITTPLLRATFWVWL